MNDERNEHIELVKIPEYFLRALKIAASTQKRERVSALVNIWAVHVSSVVGSYPVEIINEIFGNLRKKRYFTEITRLAEILIQTGQESQAVRRYYAQALIDRGGLAVALAILKELRDDCISSGNRDELFEATGLIGRVYKQIYINTHNQGVTEFRVKHLDNAISAYAEPYLFDPNNSWHGINMVALAVKACSDGVDLANLSFSPQEEALKIRTIIECKDQIGEADLWDFAIASEASLALNDYDNALAWIAKYANEEDADAFEYASTLRQFEEVWGLDSQHPEEAKILHLLRASLLEEEGGQVDIENVTKEVESATQLLEDSNYEQILGDERFVSFKLYTKGLDRAKRVAKIEDRLGNGRGTGFLVRGVDVHPSIEDEWVLVTNSHVISDDPKEQRGAKPALTSQEARVYFEGAENPEVEYKIDRIIFTSIRTELDCTVAALDPAIDCDGQPYPVSNNLPRTGETERVYVIGHPKGGKLSFSLYDNKLIDHETPRIHYKAPTEAGSSGSPVFDASWDLIALHHTGGLAMRKLNGLEGTYAANEGIAFLSIREAIVNQINAGVDAQQE